MSWGAGGQSKQLFHANLLQNLAGRLARTVEEPCLAAPVGMNVVSATHYQNLKKLCFGIWPEIRWERLPRSRLRTRQGGSNSLRAERGGQADSWFLCLSHAALSHEIMSKWRWGNGKAQTKVRSYFGKGGRSAASATSPNAMKTSSKRIPDVKEQREDN